MHLATHGLVSEIAQTASALAPQGTDRLTVADLAGLRLVADLVVLSACDTGRVFVDHSALGWVALNGRLGEP